MFKRANFLGMIFFALAALSLAVPVSAREFTFGATTLDLQEITTNADIYYTAMRYNRAAGEWDINVTVSNKTTQAFSGPLVLLIDSFTGTSGPLSADGISTGQDYFDLSGQLDQGVLPAGSNSASRTISMGYTTGASPKWVARVFAASAQTNLQALGFARSLNEVGQPLPNVAILESGPNGTGTNVTEGEFGVVTLGQAPGNYTWQFSLAGYEPVWRQAMLSPSSVSIIPFPRLVPKSQQSFNISPLTGGMATNQTIQLQFLGGTFSQVTPVQITPLEGQTLPAFLPLGWSPLQAFWLDAGTSANRAISASLTPWGPIGTAENAYLVEFNPATVSWQVLQAVPGNGTGSVSVSLPGNGAYALVVADAAPIAPAAPAIGNALPSSGVPAPNPARLLAGGTVTPASSPASLVPELVTATADVGVTNLSGSLASGTLLHGEVSELYLLEDGTTRAPPLFDNYVVGYQRPYGTPAGTVHTDFPLRPLLLFDAQTLNVGTVHIDLYAPGTFLGGVLDTNGGLVASGPVRVLAGPNVLGGQQAIQLQTLAATNFSELAGTNFTVAAAFQLAVGPIASNELSLAVSGVPTNQTFVLARVIQQDGLYGLEPRDRLHSDAVGNLFNDEPATGDRLPGLTVAGQYLLLEVNPQQGLVEGIATNSAGQATNGLPVTITGQPWLTFSARDGSYKLLAPAGTNGVTARDLGTGDTGTQSFTVATNLATVAAPVGVAQATLNVISLTPTDTSSNVPVVTAVTINFSRAINPSTLGSNAVHLIEGTNTISAIVSLNLANTTVTLLPNGSLDNGSQFQILLATNIADSIGRPLTGQNSFTFNTVPASTRSSAAQLIIYEPGATNLDTNILADLPGYIPGTNQNEVVVHGSAGTSDPGVPVVILNEASGQTTTVIAKPDGSFTSWVNGQAADFISATFISLNGSQIYVPVNRQLFDDGSVGLYAQGGTLEALGANGPIDITIPPNALQQRTKFTLTAITPSDLATQTGGVTPNLATVAGGALHLHIEGQQPSMPMQASFPVDLATLGYPTNQAPTNAALALTIVQNTQDVTTFEVVDQMLFKPQAQSQMTHRLSRSGAKPQDSSSATAGVIYTAAGFGSGPIALVPEFFDFIVVPLLLGPSPVVVTGLAEHNEQYVSSGGVLSTVSTLVTNLVSDAVNAKPLSGAFIILEDTQIGLPGRLQPGMIYATSGANGKYLMVAPAANAAYILSATHPLYSDRQSDLVAALLDLGFNGVITKNFVFHDPIGSQVPPRVNIACAPQWPAPGQDCQIQIAASQAMGAIPTISAVIGSVTNLVGGITVSMADATLTNIVTSNNGSSALWTATLHSDKSVQVILNVSINGAGGTGLPVIPYAVSFNGFVPPSTTNVIPPPDTNDIHGPLVVSVDPPYNGFVDQSGTITVLFNKPIDVYVKNHLQGIVLSGSSTTATPLVTLSSDQQALVIQYPGLEPSQTYTLTLSGQSIQDLAGKPLDQLPSTPAADSFSTTFRTPPTVTTQLPFVANGRGSAISGTHLYVIDQAPQDNFLDAFDLTLPSVPALLSQTHLFGMPRDLTVIPNFAYQRNATAPVESNELVAVVGGDLTTITDPLGNVTAKGQYLWVLNMGNEASPQILASPIVSYRVGSAVTKVRWSPPYLVYQEFGADIQQIGLVNLQEMIYGFGSTLAQISQFGNGTNGLDLNGNGSYVDPGDRLPIPPARPPEFFGKDYSYVLQNTTQKILDFSPMNGGQEIGITMEAGIVLDANGNPTGPKVRPSYRTLEPSLNIANPLDAILQFGANAYPRWVSVFNSLVVESNGVPYLPQLALVSLSPDDDTTQKLAVIDITLPEKPQLLNKIPIPDSLLGGDIQSVTLRSDGLLEVDGTKNMVLVNPRFLLATNASPDQLNPAIAGFIPAAGATTRTVGTSDYGLHVVSDGGRNLVVQSPPAMQFVNFPNSSSVVDPSSPLLQVPSYLSNLILTMAPASAIPRATLHTNFDIPSDLDPPRPASHYHVLVSAPGGSGGTIELGLESMNLAGRPLVNLGVNYPPVRAISANAQAQIGQTPRPCGAPINSLTAYRMSNDPTSPYYNRYLSKPFALMANEHASLDELTQLKSEVNREILYSGSALRAFIDPGQSNNPVIGPFAAQVDSGLKLIYPIATVNALTFNQQYVMGNNPPPPGGYTTMPGTFGSIATHSGEFRTSMEDISLPSPHMPILIQRSIGNQDTYDGPFGLGWDFNYNQRVSELDPQSFPAGLQMPLIVRDTKTNSEIASSQDVLFNTGMGRIVHFRWVDTNMPPEYARDPLVQSFNYQSLVSDYYLPEHGIFDLFVKFKDGRFERLTPDGVRYRYAPQGRLETIIDRFPKNHHDLTYDANGWLIRIDDYSVTGNRYLLFGYYREASDAQFTAGLDMQTANSLIEGKICRIQDYAGGDVLYTYDDDGELILRQSKQVAGENNGFSGRLQTHFVYNNCQLEGITVTANGIPLVASVSSPGSDGKAVAQSTTGVGGATTLGISLGNTAANLNNTKVSALLADKSTSQFSLDKFGHVNSIVESGAQGPSAETDVTNNDDGLMAFVRHPEGNTDTFVYDSGNAIFRSRGNLLSHTVDPGPRGGTGYTETYNYDPNYNQKSGNQTTPDGFTIVYTLTSDNRAVASIKDGSAGTETFLYNDNGQITTHVDLAGISTVDGFDSSTGFILSEQTGKNSFTYNYGSDYASQLGQPTTINLPVGYPVTRLYNENLQPVEITRGALDQKFAYDEQGRAVMEQIDLGDGKKPVSHMLYDVKGFLTTNILDGVEVNGQATSLEYDYTPDSLSRIQSIHFPQGTVQSFTYDNRGNTTSQTIGDYVEQYGLDLNGNVTSVTQGGDEVLTTAYDGLDRPVTITHKTGTQDDVETKTYFPGGEMKSSTVTDGSLGVISQITCDGVDEVGRPVHQTISSTALVPTPTFQYTYQAGSRTTVGPRMTVVNTWDAAGYPIQYKDAIVTKTIHPDAAGRVVQVDRQEDGATYNDYFNYDKLDNRVSYTDNAGILYQYLCRAEGSLISVTNGVGHVTSLDHSVLNELTDRRRADGMEMQFQHDPDRKPSYAGDPGAGFKYAYDQDLRMTQSTLRSGAATVYSSFDPRNMPQAATIPGGNMTMKYDLEKRLISKTVNYQSTKYVENRTYDALNRIHVTTYQQDGGAVNTATFVNDNAGPLLSAHYQEDGADFTVKFSYYADGTRSGVTYPSGVTVSEIRDNAGRLTGVSDANGNIIQATAWQGNNEPKTVQLGTAINLANTYDTRGRLVGSLATRASDGGILTHMRYQYDGANNLTARQFLHRNGKADNFTYDLGERLGEAQVGTVPLSPSGTSVPLSDRTYNYHAGGLDYLVSTVASNLSSDFPLFATNWSDHDSFLQPTYVDGILRGPADPLGNVQNAELQVRDPGMTAPASQPVAMVHNGMGQLISVTRGDGVVENNYYQPTGLRYERRLSQNGTLNQLQRFVYDDSGRLLEEYDQNGTTNQLVGRYYYAGSDAPDAADLLDPVSGNLERYYFLKDNVESIIAVADANGNVIERTWYDSFGQPVIESRDTQPPALQSISEAPDGQSLLIAFSEPVWSPNPDPGPGAGIVAFPPVTASDIVTVEINSTNLQGTAELMPSVAGYPPYSVIQFTPAQPLPDLPSALIGWWPADNGVIDVAGGHNGSLLGGAVTGPGLINQAFVLNGASAYVSVPDNAALNVGAGDFTAVLWADLKNTAGEQVLIEKWVAATKSGWSLMKMPDNSLRLAVGDGAGNETDISSGVLALAPTNWVQYAVRRQGNTFTIYTNAVPVATGTSSDNLTASTALLFGSRQGSSYFFNGSIDEVTLYGQALTAGQLTAISGGVSVPGPVTVTVNGGTLSDDWGNTNEAQTVSFQANSDPGTVFYSAEPAPNTAAPKLARSSVGSPFLFHGQYYDYDTGLIYLRSRFYDPYSGMFMEPDPLGYEDSVNHYAGMGNNPVGMRDPTGLSWLSSLGDFFKSGMRFGGRAAEGAAAELPSVGRRIIINTPADIIAHEDVVKIGRATFTEFRAEAVEGVKASERLKSVLMDAAREGEGDKTLVLGLYERKGMHAADAVDTAKRLGGRTLEGARDTFKASVTEAAAFNRNSQRFVVDVTAMGGETVRDKIESAIGREIAAKEAEALGGKEALAGMPVFSTDWEMAELNKYGRLPAVRFVERVAAEDGQVIIRDLENPFLQEVRQAVLNPPALQQAMQLNSAERAVWEGTVRNTARIATDFQYGLQVGRSANMWRKEANGNN